MASFARELKATLALAAPVAATQLGQVSLGFVDTVMVGRLGSEQLAAVALGSTVYFFFVIVGMGMVAAVGPMVAQAFGAGEHEPVERSVRQGLWLGALLALPVFGILWTAGTWLLWLGQDPATVVLTTGYLRAIAWGVLPFLWFFALRGFVEALGRPLPVTLLIFVGVGLNVLANYTLMFGHFGFPALGVAGTGWASSLVNWFFFLSLTAVVLALPTFRRYAIFSRFGRPDPEYFRELFRIGWPIGVSFGVESGLFTMTALMMGLLGTTALAAHQIALQCAAFTFMVPLGIGIAASVRVGQAAGRGDAASVRQAGLAGLALSLAFMTMTALAFWLLPEPIIGLFLDRSDPANAEVVGLAVSLLGVAALFQIFDGVQVAASGALRGLKDTRIPMLIALVTYWGVGLTAGYVLGFETALGPVGLWGGLVLGLTAAAVALTVRFLRMAAAAPAAEPAIVPPVS